jgi:hypothetical protein
MDWAAVGVIAAVNVALAGYLTRRLDRVESALRSDIKFLTERYITHLEQHAK